MLPGHSQSLRKVKSSKTGTKIEAMECGCLLAFPACFLINPRMTYLGVAPPTVGWALSNQLLIKENPL